MPEAAAPRPKEISTEALATGCYLFHRIYPDNRTYEDAIKRISQGQQIEGCINLLTTWNRRAQIPEKNYKIWLENLIKDLQSFLGTPPGDVKKFFDDHLLIHTDGNQRNEPVALAKSLNLLSPQTFPLWDGRISERYHQWHGRHRLREGSCYAEFTKDVTSEYNLIQPEELKELAAKCPTCSDLNLNYKAAFHKLLDELNICEWTEPPRGSISSRAWTRRYSNLLKENGK